MGYNNKVGLIQLSNGKGIPLNLMNEQSYKCTVNTLDLDSYRDTNGNLHRNVVLSTPTCTFETRMLKESKFTELMQMISSSYSNIPERKATLTVWVPLLAKYVSGEFYMPDTEVNIDHITKKGEIIYKPVSIQFIGYGAVADATPGNSSNYEDWGVK